MCRFWTVWLLLLLAAPACAETVTLPEALRSAVADRPMAVAARYRALAAEKAVGEANSRYWPRLLVSEGYSITDEPAGSLFIALNQERNVMTDPGYDLVAPDPQHDYETRLTLEQTLFDPDRYYGRARARLGAAAARAAGRWSGEEAAMVALLAYLEVQRAEAADNWVQSSQQEATEIQRLASERHAAGLGLKADELRARVFLAEVRRYGVASANDILVARSALALSIGRAGTVAEIAAPLTVADFPVPLQDDSIEARADLQAATLRNKVNATGVKQAHGEWLPRAALQASYAWHDESAPFGSDGSGYALWAGLKWELFDGFRRSAAGGRAVAELKAGEAELREGIIQSRHQLVEARLRSDEARLQLEMAQQALSEADESCRLLRQRYQVGLTDLADLLAAQSALDRARFDAVGAETRLLASLAQVIFAQGRLLNTFLPSLEEVVP